MALRIHWNALGIVGALAFCTAAIRPASAAPGPVLPVVGGPVSITAGAYFSSGSRVKDNGGSTQVSVDFRYLLPVSTPLTVPSRTILSIGVEAGTKSGKHSTIVPITVSEVVGANGASPIASNSPYFGGGLGVYILNTSGLATSGKFGGFLQAGYNFSSSLYADAKYQFVQDGEGFIVSGGYRF